MSRVLVKVVGLKKYFPVKVGLFRKLVGYIKAVDGVSLTISKGETFSIVGESGCGKTTLGKTIIRLYDPYEGEIWINGVEISKEKKLKGMYRHTAMVFQDPASSINPRRKVKDIIAAPLVIHKVGTRSDRLKRVIELLRLVELPPKDFMYKYPGALSGGQKQRVAIARALALNPNFVILDEPTSALDVSVQAKILNLLKELQRKVNLIYLLITHDLGVVRNFSDQIGIMYLGKLVEVASVEGIFKNLLHPYTKALLSATPVIANEDLSILPRKIHLKGEPPSFLNIPKGCNFCTRCPEATKKCEEKEPTVVEYMENHFVKCHKLD